MLITDLERHIGQGDEHGIFTGTFDPPHFGHTRAVTEAFRQTDLSSVIVIPHSWNNGKRPVPLDLRVQWLIETLGEFIPDDLKEKVTVCHDPLNNRKSK